MGGNIAVFFPTTESDSKYMIVQVLRRTMRQGPRYHYQQFEHMLSGGPVLEHAQYEGMSLLGLESCCMVGELIHHMICWKEHYHIW